MIKITYDLYGTEQYTSDRLDKPYERNLIAYSANDIVDAVHDLSKHHRDEDDISIVTSIETIDAIVI